MSRALPLLARFLLVAPFLASLMGKILDFGGTREYMASYGMPLTGLLLVGAIVLELTGGLSVLLGYRARWGAVALIVFLVPATLVFHTDFSDQEQIIHFLKNLAILGGLLLVIVHGAGAASLDRRAAGRTGTAA